MIEQVRLCYSTDNTHECLYVIVCRITPVIIPSAVFAIMLITYGYSHIGLLYARRTCTFHHMPIMNGELTTCAFFILFVMKVCYQWSPFLLHSAK